MTTRQGHTWSRVPFQPRRRGESTDPKSRSPGRHPNRPARSHFGQTAAAAGSFWLLATRSDEQCVAWKAYPWNDEQPFVSTSDMAFGSSIRDGRRWWIDIAKVRASGARIHDGTGIARDLDGIAAKVKDPIFRRYIEDVRNKSLNIDREIVFEGPIPAAAVKSATSIGFTRGLQFAEGVGVILTFYDLGQAGAQSYRAGTIKPLAKETFRQVGGWGAAWAGAEI